MSTRCQIGFYNSLKKNHNEWEALVYKHWDGYPSNMLPIIVPILQDFHKHRGLDDAEYAAAFLISKIKTDYLDIGVCRDFHGDIDYFYKVGPEGINVYSVGTSQNEPKFKLDRKATKEAMNIFNSETAIQAALEQE